MLVCDGLKGLPDAVEQVWPQTIVQTCIVHLLRNIPLRARQRLGADRESLKPVYTAPSESEALDRFAEFTGKWEKRYPAIIKLWENAWAEFVPFLRLRPGDPHGHLHDERDRVPSTPGYAGRSTPAATSPPSRPP